MRFKYFLFLLSFLAVFLPDAHPVLAQSPTPAASASATKTDKLEELKDRLATVVAELRHTQRRAISGTIKSTSITTAIIETETKDLKIELLDELTVLQVISGKRTTLTVDDLAQGDKVAVFGEYDTTLDLMKAKVIFIQAPLPAFIVGTITGMDTRAATLSVLTASGPTYTVDIERTTQTQSWTEGKIIKSGFSQLRIADTVHIAATLDPKDSSRASALRVLSLGNLSGATPTPTQTATSSATATPSATPRPTTAP